MQTKSWYYQQEKPEFAFAGRHIAPGDRVLEIGCGNGAFAAVLPSDVVYRGLEFNGKAIEACRIRGLDVEARDVSTEALSNPGTYDVVCHFQVLEHVSEPGKFLSDCAACLRVGGKMIVAVPAEDSFLSLVEDGWLNMPPHHLTRWSDRSLECAIRALGMMPLEKWHEPVAEYHRAWYRCVMMSAGLRRMLRLNVRLASGRVWGGLVRRLSASSQISERLVKFGEQIFPFAGRGHTVCLVAEKPDLAEPNYA